MKIPKYIIFDCDGVLVDSEFLANKIEVDVKSELGFPITLEEQLKKFVGLGWNDPILQEELARLPKNYVELVDNRLKSVYLNELKPISGVVDLLNKMTQPKCVASNSETEWLNFKLSITKLDGFFPEAVFSRNMVSKGKPAPDLFFHAVEKMGWNSSQCLVVEDSEVGVKAGRAAGMTVCGFLGGKHILPGHGDRLMNAGANFTISNFSDLLPLL